MGGERGLLLGLGVSTTEVRDLANSCGCLVLQLREVPDGE
jgi:hypothetical protein